MPVTKGKKRKQSGKSSAGASKASKRSGPGWTLVSAPDESDDEEDPQPETSTGRRQTRSGGALASVESTEGQETAPSRPRARRKVASNQQERGEGEDPFIIRRAPGSPATGLSLGENTVIPLPAPGPGPETVPDPMPDPPAASVPSSTQAPVVPSTQAPVAPSSTQARVVPLAASVPPPTQAPVVQPAAMDPRFLFDDVNLLTMPELPDDREPSLPPSNQLALAIRRPPVSVPDPQTPVQQSHPHATLDEADLAPFKALGMAVPASSTPGPIPAKIQEEAFAIHAEYQRSIESLAKSAGKAPEAFYALLGSGSHLSRGRDFSGWAAWQVWYAHYGEERPSTTPIGDWTRHVARKYTEHIQQLLAGRPDTPANRREVLEPTIQWYREHFAKHVVHLKSQGKMKQLVNKVVDDCLAISMSAYELYGIHVCGFAVNLDPDKSNRTHSAPWGASPEYEKMLKNYKPIISRDLQNWESHLRVSQTLPKGDDDSSLFLVPIKGYAPELSKDQHRRIFSAYLRMDLARIMHRLHDVPAPAAVLMQVKYSKWAVQATAHKLRFLNWPRNAHLPKRGFVTKTHVKGKYIKASNNSRHAMGPSQAFPLRASHGDFDYIAIVSWSEEEMQLNPDDDGFKDIPIVVDADGETVLTAAAASEAEQQDGSKKKTKARVKYNSNFERVQESKSSSDSSDSDSSSDDDDDDSPPPEHAKKRRAGGEDVPQRPRKKKEKVYQLTAAQMQQLMAGRGMGDQSD
ncbi:hypothetical protein H0H92_004420 [Tricholoma furcatifolium]|nr:hypothetical protein H0H92_004420 [Tricholoma furcatifolium]